MEGQRLHALLPQVQQQAGVNHGHREAALLVAVAGGEVLSCAAVVALQGPNVAVTFFSWVNFTDLILPDSHFSSNKPVLSLNKRKKS